MGIKFKDFVECYLKITDLAVGMIIKANNDRYIITKTEEGHKKAVNLKTGKMISTFLLKGKAMLEVDLYVEKEIEKCR